jgi:hypothetical protein
MPKLSNKCLRATNAHKQAKMPKGNNCLSGTKGQQMPRGNKCPNKQQMLEQQMLTNG